MYRHFLSILTVAAASLFPGVASSWIVMDVDSMMTSNKTQPLFTFEKRATASEVVHNKYFIPAVASMGGILIVVALCFWWLGWCCNRRKMDNYHAKMTYPTRRDTTTVQSNVPPLSNRTSQLSRKGAPSLAGRNSVVGSTTSPIATSPTHPPNAAFNASALYANPNAGVPRAEDQQDGASASYKNVGTTPGQNLPYGAYAPSATSHTQGQGFQAVPPSTLAASIAAAAAGGSVQSPTGSVRQTPMSVHHVNTSAAAAYANTHRNFFTSPPQSQYPAQHPLVNQQSAAAAAAAMRMSSFSSATTSTQVGGEAPPAGGYTYSPHAGNTLSYASSTPSTTSTPGVAGIGVPPIPVPPPTSYRPAQGEQIPQESYYTAQSVPPPNSRKTTGYSGEVSGDNSSMNPYDGVGSSGHGSPDNGQAGPSAYAEAPPGYRPEGRGSVYPKDKKEKR